MENNASNLTSSGVARNANNADLPDEDPAFQRHIVVNDLSQQSSNTAVRVADITASRVSSRVGHHNNAMQSVTTS